MRSGLKNGVLVPPKSLAAALDRERRLGIEIERITTQLRDQSRGDAWLTRARLALHTFSLEVVQLRQWIAAERARLFREAYDLIKAFESDGADLAAAELNLIHRLDAYFAATRPPQAKVSHSTEDSDMPPKAQQKKQDEEQDTQFQLVADIVSAKEIAESIFGVHCTAAVVLEVFDNMPIEEDLADEYADQLKKAQEIAGEVFGASAKADPSTVLGIYTRVLAPIDEDEAVEEDENEND